MTTAGAVGDLTVTLGIEEEFFLIDPETRDLLTDPDPAIFEACERNRGPHKVVHEFLRSQIETNTRVCASVQQARAGSPPLGLRVRPTGRGLPPCAVHQGWQRAVVGYSSVAQLPHDRGAHLRHLSADRGRDLHRSDVRLAGPPPAAPWARREVLPEPPTEIIAENRWLAQRYGVLAFFGHPTRAGRIDIADYAVEFVAELMHDARALDCEDEVRHALTIIRDGSGADRQLDHFRLRRLEGDSDEEALRSVVDLVVAETKAGIEDDDA